MNRKRDRVSAMIEAFVADAINSVAIDVMFFFGLICVFMIFM